MNSGEKRRINQVTQTEAIARPSTVERLQKSAGIEPKKKEDLHFIGQK